MTRKMRAFLCILLLSFALGARAGANPITNGGGEDDVDPSAWSALQDSSGLDQWFSLPQKTHGVEIRVQCLFNGAGTGCYVNDPFVSTFIFASMLRPQITPKCLLRQVIGQDLSSAVGEYTAYFCVSALWEYDQDAREGFDLLEACGLVCDQRDTWVILDEILAGADPAPVPEPATILLIGSGLVSAGLISRMRRRKNRTG